MIKCIGCYKLQREVINWAKPHRNVPTVVYGCVDCRLPYYAALSGLLRPSIEIREAAEKCPEQPLSRCVLCSQMTDLIHYGHLPDACACEEHNKAWSKWLDDHPDRLAHLAPKGRVRRANWIKVFREFVEDMRLPRG